MVAGTGPLELKPTEAWATDHRAPSVSSVTLADLQRREQQTEGGSADAPDEQTWTKKTSHTAGRDAAGETSVCLCPRPSGLCERRENEE